MKNNESTGSCKLSIGISILALAAAGASYFAPKKAGPEDASTFDEKVKCILLDVAKQDPQVFMDAIGEGFAKKKDDAVKQLASEVGTHKDEIDAQCMKFGDLGSKKVIICFFDPLCSHCVEFQQNMLKIIDANKGICFKLMPVGVLGDDSIRLAKVLITLYAAHQDKVLKFINELVNGKGEMDKSAIEEALKKVEVDIKEIEGMMEESDKKLIANGKLAEQLKLPFVPGIFAVVGAQIVSVQSTDIDQLIGVFDQNSQPEEKLAEEPAAKAG
ncbi:MAG: thioredoxin domain-containing protein [Holosporales bacterium]|jgi:protein-disulfide isomerase|nr:thioredoxin domain-containing protein [Holosporales bacterium]